MQKNSQTITYFPTTYKILTSILKESTVRFIECIFPFEPKRCKKESYRCKDQFLINKMIMKKYQSK